MSFAGKLALGVATGLAGYYGKVAEQQMEEKRSAIALAREKALAQFQSGLRREESAIAGAETRKSYTHKVETDVVGELALLPKKGEEEIRVAEAKEAAQL